MRPTVLPAIRPAIPLTIACAAFAAWACAVALLTGAGLSLTAVYLWSPASLVLGVALGTWLRRSVRVQGLALCVGAATLFMVLTFPLAPGPAAGPLIYPNANAALAIQLIGLSGVALHRAEGMTRWTLRGSAVSAYGVVLLNQSRAGAVVGLLVLVAAFAPRPRAGALRAVAVSAAVVVATMAMWVVQAAAHKPWTEALPFPDPVRSHLWEDALTVWLPHPLRGAGPGAFVHGAALATDPDTATAHSVLMQVGAETGAVGAILLGAVFLAGLIAATRSAGGCALVAVAAWTALWMHALVDHLAEFVPIVAAAGLVLGWSGPSEQLDITEGEDPV